MILLSPVTAWVALTLSETTVFAGLREWLKARSLWLGKLACCGYYLATLGGLRPCGHLLATPLRWVVAAEIFPHRAGHRLARRLPVGRPVLAVEAAGNSVLSANRHTGSWGLFADVSNAPDTGRRAAWP